MTACKKTSEYNSKWTYMLPHYSWGAKRKATQNEAWPAAGRAGAALHSTQPSPFLSLPQSFQHSDRKPGKTLEITTASNKSKTLLTVMKNREEVSQ